MQQSKHFTRKELERAVRRMHGDMQTLVKHVDNLTNIIQSTNKVTRELVGVITVLKQKGVITDVEIAKAIVDASEKDSKESGVQSAEAGKAEDNSGHGGQ